jgi:DNA-binding Lrp family transcriptional regulator
MVLAQIQTVDSKDFRLLVALHENARQSYRSLGRSVSLSAPAVRSRLERLQRRRVLQGYWLYVDPSVFEREDVMVFFSGNWTRQDIVKALSVPDVAFAGLKLDGGVTVQLWPRDHRQPAKELAAVLGAEPFGQAYTESRSIRSLSLADWRIIDALIDDPTMPLKRLMQETGLSPKTIRKHLQRIVEEEVVSVMPLLGALVDPGELVYHLAVVGRVGMRELRQVLGDVYMVGGAEQPPMKYLLCRAEGLADVTTRTQAVSKLRGVDSVRVTLNRELLVGNEFVHSLVRERIQQWERLRRR